MSDELNPNIELNQYELDPHHAKQDDLERSAIEAQALDDSPDPEIENAEMNTQTLTHEDKREQAFDSWTHKIPVIGNAMWTLDSAAAGTGDFIFDAVGLVPWLKPAEEWWDNNSPRSRDPMHKIVRDASSVIVPSLYGGMGLVGHASKAARFSTLPSWGKTLGSVAAYAGIDTSVAMISSHSKTDDNIAATLNNWLGWGIPWATRDTDSPDVRWKKNVYENAGLAAGTELLGVTFALARKAKLFPRDEAAAALIGAKNAKLNEFDNPVTAAVETQRKARTAAQTDEMVDALQKDPGGANGYNAFINDLGEDTAGKAVANVDVDPLVSKLDHARIQGNIGTTNGRAAAVADENFQKKLIRSINGNERAIQLDQLFNAISPNFDAVVPYGTKSIKITAEQMNRAVDNLVQATFDKNISFGEYNAIVDNMKSTVFNSNAVLDEDTWVNYSKAFKNAYDNVFDPNQVRASAMLTQQTGDSIADIASAAMMLGDDVDTSRQFKMMFDKLNLLDSEMSANKFIFAKAEEYKRLINTGNDQVVISWLTNQADNFDKYLDGIRATNDEFTNTLWNIAKEDHAYFRPLKEVFAKTNGNVDTIHKLKKYAESKLGLIKKGIIDGEPEVSSVVIKGLHGARIQSLLSGLSAGSAAIGNMTLTALKPASVLLGTRVTGNTAAFKRATYTYSGIMENFRRGFKVMQSEWNFAKNFPEEAMMRGRVDLQKSKMDTLEELEGLAEIWRRDGEEGKLAMWNMAKGLTWWNKQWFTKYGTNALYAIDGFTNSFMASGMARARAYDEVMHMNRGAVKFDDMFDKTQKRLYNEAFDATGLLTDEAAKHASREIALNLDNQVVNNFERFLDHVPAARGVFLFPRTGVNAFEVGWSFNPASNLGPAMTKARRVLGAHTGEAKLAALREHGLDTMENADIAFETLKSEYIGRQIMGASLVMGVGSYAIDGNVTGSGPQDDAERRRMVAIGWKPYSIKNPITGEYRSYAGIEPFASIMGLTADIVYQANRVDQAVTEDLLRKVGHSISMNITNNMFISGFETLAGLISGDPSAWTRFFAQQTDMLIPAKGARSILNNIIAPQVKDVQNEYLTQLKNMNKWLFNQDDNLPDMIDIYTGQPIKHWEGGTRAANALLPMFKSNGGMEPWRQWLLATGWDSLQKIRRDKYTMEPLSAIDRQFINNWIGKNAKLQAQIVDLMTKDDGWYDKKIKEYRKERGQLPQSQLPLRDFVVHRELDSIHDKAFDAAWDELEAYKNNYTEIGREIYNRKMELRRGNVKEAKQTNKRVQNLIQTRNK